MTATIHLVCRGTTTGLALVFVLAGVALAGQPAGAPATGDWFSEVAANAGIRFVHFNGMSGALYYPEIVGPGAALFDYDNDGDLDIYFVQGRMLGPGKSVAQAIFPPPPGSHEGDRLYRNDLSIQADGGRVVRFTDVTEVAGIHTGGYGIGVATGDADNDGWVDLYVARYGSNQLWHNNGDGTFSDVTARTDVDDPHLSVSASFFDFDRDGWLDLYVVNHVVFDLETHKPCVGSLGTPEYCATRMYTPVPSRMFRNRGDGRFEDVSKGSGISAVFGAGLGVVSADFNDDGWPDLYVANDGNPNQLWINQGDGTFRDEALLAGAAVNVHGAAEAGMGVDAGDFDGDGDEDLFVTNDTQETNTLYVNDGTAWFQDRSTETGVGPPSLPFTGFGTAWVDYDNDGWLDLFVVNGAVRRMGEAKINADPFPLRQTNQLFANLGNGRFREVTQDAGAAFGIAAVGRGAAFGDIDNDGDVDVLVANNSGAPALFLNNVGNKNHWLGLRLLDASGRDALGARVAVEVDSGRTLWRRVHTDGSYASANDPRLIVGLGQGKARGVRVRWPSGRTEAWPPPAEGRYTVLREGGGKQEGRAVRGTTSSR
jgi:enediyne biosynthesis protein E4